MIERDKMQFASILGGMAEVYGKEISKQALALHFKVLEAFSIEEVQAAAISILANRKYSSMPTPADFLEHLGGGSAEDKAEIEASKVLTAIGRYGGYASVVFDSPVTMAVIQNCYGGWPKLCETVGTEESELWFRKNFAKSWAAFSRQGAQVFGVLAGRHEIQNTAGGFLQHIDPPKLIGDQEKARAVLETGKQQALEAAQGLALPAALSASRGTRSAPTSIGEILAGEEVA